MSTIYEAITPQFISNKWTMSVRERKPFLGELFFPARKQLGIQLAWLKGAKPSIQPLSASSFDAKAMPLSREAFSKVETEMPFFKNSKNINEKLRQELLKVMQTGNQEYINNIKNEIYNDEEELLAGADLARERMRMLIMTTGKIEFTDPNGQSLAYDFGVPSGNLKTSDWETIATSDPVKDLNDWADYIEQENGVRPTSVMMNKTTFNLIAKSTAVKNAMYVFANGTVTPTATDATTYISTQTNLKLYIYNKGYKISGTFTKFVADNKVVMFVEDLGYTNFGTTPEEADLMGSTNARVSIVDTGVAITTSQEIDPVNVMTKVSMVCLPTITNANLLLIADVSAVSA
jgi:hypothetical protein